ncbi:MAG: GntR family transcriptional regulator [Sphaerochaetaceae bacterium]
MQLKYQAVFLEIQNKIISGYWPEDTMIPTELELCKAHGVSRITVRRALDELVQLGLIRRSRGKGSFVCGTKRYSEYRNGQISQDGVELNRKVSNRILEKQYFSASAELAQKFQPTIKAKGDGVFMIKVLRLIDDVPYALMSIFLPEAVGQRIGQMDVAQASIIELYYQATGQRIVTLHRTVSAIIPDATVCALLDMQPNTAHLWIKSIACLADDTPAAITYTIYNGNLFDFAVNIDLQNPPRILL